MFMAYLWNRLPIWADWIVAVVVAIVLLNLNVTAAGDPLSGAGLSAGPASPGIIEGARAIFYGVLIIGGLLLTAVGIALLIIEGRGQQVSRLLVSTYPWIALAGVLGLLLDYRDGPVRTVQLVVYLTLAVGIIRLARITSLASIVSDTDGSRSNAD
jgi:hypothetical protein|tara:strand:+ start:1794 stop:2261 length:468 start_codon:yes stop_codon:yes gene_type:complete